MIQRTANQNLVDGVGASFTIAHGLGSMPKYVRPVLVCTVNDAASGIVAGQEIDAEAIVNPEGANLNAEFGQQSDTVHIKLIYFGDSGGSCSVPGSGNSFSDFGNFKLATYFSS